MLFAVGPVADAQTAAATTPSNEQLEEVVVTGSRIVLPNMGSTSPIQVSGKVDASDVILQLPQNFNSSFSGCNGRTSALTTAGGAPAAYGSDAIAGAINFVMKRKFQGVRVGGQIGEHWHEQHNKVAQGLNTAPGYTPLTGSIHDGRNTQFNITTWRFIGGVSLDDNDSNPLLFGHAFQDGTGASTYNYFDAHIAPYSYLDLSASWAVHKGIELRAGSNNIMDKDPPLVTSEITSGGASNTFEAYDTLGRQLFAAFTAKF